MKYIIMTLAVLLSKMSFAQNTVDPDWPCIQVLVPKISAATIWDGPAVDDVESSEVLTRASSEIIANVIDYDQALIDQDIDEYLQTTTSVEPNQALTHLFGRFLDRLNTKRATQIKTIKRYTKTQRDSATKIENLLDKITALQNQSERNTEKIELESQLHWQKRMFKERETSFKYLCELPQEIFQKAGEIARTISSRLQYE